MFVKCKFLANNCFIAMKKFFYGLCLLFVMASTKCRKKSDIECAYVEKVRVDLTLYDAKTGKRIFNELGSPDFQNIPPEEVNLYEENFTPLILDSYAFPPGMEWNLRNIRNGFVRSPLEIPYVDKLGHTRDSVGKPIYRTYYLKIKNDIDTIRINYHMDNICNMKNYFLQVYYNDSLYIDKKNISQQIQVKIYKKSKMF